MNKSKGSKKLMALCGAMAALIVIIIAYLALKSPVFYGIAVNKAKQNQFKTSQSYLTKISSPKADALEAYINLRIEINSQYPTLIASFDIDTVRQWNSSASEIKNNCNLLPGDIQSTALSLCDNLENICNLYDEYLEIYPDILSLMDVFTEINKFYSKDENGKNKAITVKEERDKLARWTLLLTKVEGFFAKLPSDNVYLMNYMLKEAQGEINDISDTMDKLIEKGFKETDSIIIKGEPGRTFTSVTSSLGTTIKLTEKEEYAENISYAIYRDLAKMLAEYYLGI